MSQMLKSSGAMAGATMASRVLGLVREGLYAWFMGDSRVAGAFKLALMIPNLFRRLLGEGALTAAFIPVFKAKEKNEGEAAMWRAANAVISGLVITSAAIIALVMLGVSLVLWAGDWTSQTRLMLELLRVMFPYMLLVCLAALFMGMLNARGHFFIPAMGAVMLNVVLIGSVLLVSPVFGRTPLLAPVFGGALDQRIFGLAIGVLVAGVAQAFFQWPILRREGFRYHWISPWKNQTVQHVVRQMIPGTIGVAAFQLNVLTTQGVAYWKDATIVASFDYAVRLMELPQGVFGISLATFLLPTLAGLAAEKKFVEYRSTLEQGMGYLLFLNTLAAVFLVTLAEPMVRLLFERGLFTAQSTARVALALATLGPGLIGYSMVNILARAFYALGDTRTPMRVSVLCLMANLVMVLILIGPYRQAGLGAANSTSAMINVGLLTYALKRKLTGLALQEVRRMLAPIAIAAVLAGGTCWVLSRFWETHLGHANLPLKLGAVFVPMTVASAVYAVVALASKVPYAKDFVRFFVGRLRRR